MNWIVENFVGDNGYDSLISEIKRQGMNCYVLDISNHFNLNKDVIQKIGRDCVLFQGSIQMFRKLKKETSLYPLGWMSDENYLCTKYFPIFQDFLFNDKYCFVPLATLKANKFFFYGIFGKDTMIYVRPNQGDKLFKGQLLDLQDFDRMWSNNCSSSATDSDLVLISTPKNIRGEWRFIVTSQKEILGCSTYQYHGNRTYIPSAPKEATKLCERILNVGYFPDPVFTIDICEDNDGNFWMVEMNSFTSAGTYEAPKAPIVKRVSEIAEQDWGMYQLASL